MAEEFRKIVIKEVFGKKIRKHNYVSMFFNADDYERLIRQSEETGIKLTALIAIKSQPCSVCGNDEVSLIIKKTPIYLREALNNYKDSVEQDTKNSRLNEKQ